MIYITGDNHRDFKRIYEFAGEHETTKEDILIILGDVGINYYGNHHGDLKLKKKLRNLNLTLFMLRGNHDMNHEAMDIYDEVDFMGGRAFVEKGFPSLIFAKDGEIYEFEIDNVKRKVLTIGGAYSVDKSYRLTRGMNWFSDEQPTQIQKERSEANLEVHNWDVDLVLTHTCPYRYEPREVFLPMVDQNTVDKSTEHWLDDIHDRLSYERWYCGHWHVEKIVDKMIFMYEDIRILR